MNINLNSEEILECEEHLSGVILAKTTDPMTVGSLDQVYKMQLILVI